MTYRTAGGTNIREKNTLKIFCRVFIISLRLCVTYYWTQQTGNTFMQGVVVLASRQAGTESVESKADIRVTQDICVSHFHLFFILCLRVRFIPSIPLSVLLNGMFSIFLEASFEDHILA